MQEKDILEEDVLDMIMTDEEYIQHYGMPRRSGRYPWGSGENPFQHSGDFLSRVRELEKQGLKEKDIAESLGMSTTKYRAAKSIAIDEQRALLVKRAESLKADGLSNPEIARQMGLKGESSVRSLLNKDAKARMNVTKTVAEKLKNSVDEKGMIDVGAGVDRQLGIPREKLNQALDILEMEGYEVYGGRVPQATNPGRMTTIKVLCPPGTEHKEIFNYENVHSITEYTSRDEGKTFEPTFVYPSSMKSDRLKIRYAEDGGIDKDGVMEIRPGVKDLSLGESHYAQVRILVDGNRYLKGMAVYGDPKDFPDGVDVIFNTNKTKDVEKMDVLKKIKDDPVNPFGALIPPRGQSYYLDPNGNYTDPVTGEKKSLSLINKARDESEWGEWSHELPSQFLAKQNMPLINKQIKLALDDKQDEYNELCSLTNPTIKKNLLMSFADDCESAAVSLQAAALPGQKYQVIMPITSLKDNEAYAPSYKDGSQLALVRYPHGGTFEIPIVTVNNRNEEGKKYLSANPVDAIGINSNVAGRLSGADFDGDTVMVIPLTNKFNISSTPPLKGLEGFSPTLRYGADKEIVDKNGDVHYYRGGKEFKVMKNTDTEMGKISNLITDMTLKGATNDELERAVRHSMVVIDAEKHKLDYKQSYEDNGIAELKNNYQGKVNDKGKTVFGASTLISQAKSPVNVKERKEGAFFTRDTNEPVTLIDPDNDIYMINKTGEIIPASKKKTVYYDPKTGEKLYHDTNRTYLNATVVNSKGKKKDVSAVIGKDGKYYVKDESGRYTQEVPESTIIKKYATSSVPKMGLTTDAKTLSSGTPQEEAYAAYANKLKSLALQARKEALATQSIPYSPAANKTYKNEANSLEYKLNQSLLNAPKERQAQLISASAAAIRIKDHPEYSTEQKQRIKQQELTNARAKVGAKRNPVEITPKEWEAIQAGAISPSKLDAIFKNSNKTTLRQLATPKQTVTLSPTKISRMKSMQNSGYTTAEIAEALGVSSSTVLKYLNNKE